jgi:hypothetical protein
LKSVGATFLRDIKRSSGDGRDNASVGHSMNNGEFAKIFVDCDDDLGMRQKRG